MNKNDVLKLFAGKVCDEEAMKESGIDWGKQAMLLPMPIRKDHVGVILFKVEEGLLEIPCGKVSGEKPISVDIDNAVLIEKDRINRIYSALVHSIMESRTIGDIVSTKIFIGYFQMLNRLTAGFDLKIELVLENDLAPVTIKSKKALEDIINEINNRYFISVYVLDEKTIIPSFPLNKVTLKEEGELEIIDIESLYTSSKNTEVAFKLAELEKMAIMLYRTEDVIQLIMNNVLIICSYKYHDYNVEVNAGRVEIDFDKNLVKKETISEETIKSFKEENGYLN